MQALLSNHCKVLSVDYTHKIYTHAYTLHYVCKCYSTEERQQQSIIDTKQAFALYVQAVGGASEWLFLAGERDRLLPCGPGGFMNLGL